jgi:hypothetical protein
MVLSEPTIKRLEMTMQTKYASLLGERYFEVSASKISDGIMASVTLRDSQKSFYYPVEARMRNEYYRLTPEDAALFLVDYIDIYFDEYLREQGDVYLPIDWADYSYDGKDFQLRGQIRNLLIEEMADAILERGESSSKEDLN